MLQLPPTSELTPDYINSLPAGELLDALVQKYLVQGKIYKPSTSLRSAMKVFNMLRLKYLSAIVHADTEGYMVTIEFGTSEVDAAIDGGAQSETFELAVCRTALVVHINNRK